MRLEIIDKNKTVRVELHTNHNVFDPSEAMKNLKAYLIKAVTRYENAIEFLESKPKAPRKPTAKS